MSNEVNESLALHEVKLEKLTPIEKVGLTIFLLGLGAFFFSCNYRCWSTNEDVLQ